MMPTVKLLVAALIFVICASCDPVRTLVVKVADAPNLSVAIYGNAALLPYGDEEAAEKRVIRVASDVRGERRDTTFTYGLGGWNMEGVLPAFVTHIDSIILMNSTEKSVLKDKKEIMAYLKAHKTGYLGCMLTIEAE